MPWILIFVFLPLTFAVALCATCAMVAEGERSRPVAWGVSFLAGIAGLSVLHILISTADWVHLLWSVTFPLCGFWAGSGLLLVHVWSADRTLYPKHYPRPLRGINGATIFLCVSLMFALLPVVLVSLFDHTWPPGRVTGNPLPGLLEAARYGFDGTVPALMQLGNADQIVGSLGSSPRFITVPMGTTLIAAVGWIAFAVLALVGRAIPAGHFRRAILLMAPVGLATYWQYAFDQNMRLDAALWRNEPWLVAAYGPTLALAAIMAVVLFPAIWIDARRRR